MASPRDSFGKPKEGGQYKIISIGEGESKVVRFFPPMKSMAAKGLWASYVKQHYGYGVKDKKNADGKLRLRPFKCVEEKEESGLVTLSCPECRNVENIRQAEKDAVAVRTADLQNRGFSKEQIAAEVDTVHKGYAQYLRDHNLDCKWFIPVKTEDGVFGLLKIPHKGKKAIDKVRTKEKSKKNGSDLLDIDNGYWVRVTRTGTGLQTDYDAEPVTETVDTPNGTFERIKKAQLSDADLEQALAAIPDLGSPSLFRNLTKDQIQMLVDSKGNPDVVETVLNMSQRVKTADSAAVVEDDAEDEPQASPVLPTRTSASAGTGFQAPELPVMPAPLTSTSAPVVDEEAELEQKLLKLRAAKATATAATPAAPVQQPATKPAPAKASAPIDPSMSDDEFMTRYGPGKATSAR